MKRQLARGEADPRILRRFYRKGKRDGRRRRKSAAIAEFIKGAVAASASTIAEEYLQERRRIESALSEAAETAKAKTNQASQTVSAPLVNAVTGEAGTAIKHAVDAFNVERKRKHDELVEREGEALKKEVTDLEAKAATLEAQRDELAGHYLQRVNTAHEIGETIWGRYATGYEVGLKGFLGFLRRVFLRRRDDDTESVTRPALDIRFKAPKSLLDGTDQHDGTDQPARERTSAPEVSESSGGPQ